MSSDIQIYTDEAVSAGSTIEGATLGEDGIIRVVMKSAAMSGTATVSVGAPDPVAAFNARREAKRAAMVPGKSDTTPPRYSCARCGRTFETYQECNCRRTGDYIARAMRTPGPHDSDIHGRVMGWRGAR